MKILAPLLSMAMSLTACGDNALPEAPATPDAPLVDASPSDADRGPRGPEILYMRWNGGPELVIGVPGGDITPVRRLEGGVGGAGQPAVSPDGTKVAFLTFDDQAVAWALITRSLRDVSSTETVLAHTTGSASPVWSPDGTQIAYTSFIESFTYGVFVVPSAGGEAKLVTRVHVDGFPQSLCIAPQWSPDGTELVYSTVYGLAAYNLVEGRERTLVPLEAFWICAPKWSPDGSAIAYARGAPSVGAIAHIARSGGAAKTLAPMVGGIGTGQVAWSPDGSQIAYVNFEDEGVLRVVPTNGGANRLLARLGTGVSAGHPTFSSDGATVLYVRFADGARLTTVPAAGGEITDLQLVGAHIENSYATWLKP